MTPTETRELLRMIKAVCPAQIVDEYTPDAWAVMLARIEFADAVEAIKVLGLEQPYIHVSDIAKRVRANRDKAARRLPPADPPADLDPDDTRAYIAWRTGQRHAELEAS